MMTGSGIVYVDAQRNILVFTVKQTDVLDSPVRMMVHWSMRKT